MFSSFTNAASFHQMDARWARGRQVLLSLMLLIAELRIVERYRYTFFIKI
jgi:hypothetical protein